VAVEERGGRLGAASSGLTDQEESSAAVTQHPHLGSWAQRLGLALAIVLFVAALFLIIASITAI
jgi:hypothetical protein